MWAAEPVVMFDCLVDRVEGLVEREGHLVPDIVRLEGRDFGPHDAPAHAEHGVGPQNVQRGVCSRQEPTGASLPPCQ